MWKCWWSGRCSRLAPHGDRGIAGDGLSQERHFQNYHWVLNRARWSSLAVAQVLLGMVVRTFPSMGAVVSGLDDTLERRRGQKIKAKGIYRDPVRPRTPIWCKPVGCAGSVRWCWPRFRGPSGYGLAVSHGAISLRTLSSATKAAPQAVAAVSWPTHWPDSSLAARTEGSRGD